MWGGSKRRPSDPSSGLKGKYKSNSSLGRDTPPIIKVGTATYPDEALSKKDLFQKAKERLRGEK